MIEPEILRCIPTQSPLRSLSRYCGLGMIKFSCAQSYSSLEASLIRISDPISTTIVLFIPHYCKIIPPVFQRPSIHSDQVPWNTALPIVSDNLDDLIIHQVDLLIRIPDREHPTPVSCCIKQPHCIEMTNRLFL